MFANLANVFERFVVGVEAEIGGPEVAAETFDGLNDALSFTVEGVPGTFVIEGGAGDEDDGADEAVRLLLLERGAEAIAADVWNLGCVGLLFIFWIRADEMSQSNPNTPRIPKIRELIINYRLLCVASRFQF